MWIRDRDITVGMQQRTEILKMLYRDNEILIFYEPTAVLTPQEIDELMHIMKHLTEEGKSCLLYTSAQRGFHAAIPAKQARAVVLLPGGGLRGIRCV